MSFCRNDLQIPVPSFGAKHGFWRFDCFFLICFCPKNPDPSKMAILRTRTPAIQVRVQGFLGWFLLCCLWFLGGCSSKKGRTEPDRPEWWPNFRKENGNPFRGCMYLFGSKYFSTWTSFSLKKIVVSLLSTNDIQMFKATPIPSMYDIFTYIDSSHPKWAPSQITPVTSYSHMLHVWYI